MYEKKLKPIDIKYSEIIIGMLLKMSEKLYFQSQPSRTVNICVLVDPCHHKRCTFRCTLWKISHVICHQYSTCSSFCPNVWLFLGEFCPFSLSMNENQREYCLIKSSLHFQKLYLFRSNGMFPWSSKLRGYNIIINLSPDSKL